MRCCRATGSRSWRTPSTRTTSSGCTAATSSSSATGSASRRRRPSSAGTSRSPSTSSSTASSSGACSKGTPRRTTTGRSATRWSSRTACGWAAAGSTRCRSACRATIPEYELRWRDGQGNHIVDYVEGQDIMAWVTQGAITDRTVEHLGKSDVGIAMLRKQFKQQLAAVAEGRDPIGVVRDPARNSCIDLPCEKNKFGAGAEFAIQWIDRGFSRYSPQLDELRRLHVEAAESRAKVATGA